jgi:DNA adenine methylase
MLLRRQGNKESIADKIISNFPKHNTYIEPFFGAGGLFFNKPLVQYNIVNDLDLDVYNLYMVLTKDFENLKSAFLEMPFHEELHRYWKINKETDPVKKAVRFLFLSNYVLYGTPTGSLHSSAARNQKQLCLDDFVIVRKKLQNVKFFNRDFKEFLKIIDLDLKSSFIYADPPYLATGGNYSDHFKEQDSLDLFDSLESKGSKWAMSEFNNPFIINQAKKRKLNVIEIGERRNINNRRTEILVTNYDNKLKPLF